VRCVSLNILVTNDDGIASPGIWALAGALSRVGNVLVVAPDKQQSGVGSGVSFGRDGLLVHEVTSALPGVTAFSVGGTPSDCVLIGLKRISKVNIDLLASGINLGPNVGHDIPFSGTVMATLSGYFRKIPSLAVSLATRDKNEKTRFDIAARFAATVAENIHNGCIDASAIINVNVPNLPPEDIKGIRVTRAADFGYVHLGTMTTDGKIAAYDVTTRKPDNAALAQGTDVWALAEGYISITPLRLDVTHHELIPVIADCLGGLDTGYLGKPEA
jgi:5'-nucleotidase